MSSDMVLCDRNTLEFLELIQSRNHPAANLLSFNFFPSVFHLYQCHIQFHTNYEHLFPERAGIFFFTMSYTQLCSVLAIHLLSEYIGVPLYSMYACMSWRRIFVTMLDFCSGGTSQVLESHRKHSKDRGSYTSSFCSMHLQSKGWGFCKYAVSNISNLRKCYTCIWLQKSGRVAYVYLTREF